MEQQHQYVIKVKQKKWQQSTGQKMKTNKYELEDGAETGEWPLDTSDMIMLIKSNHTTTLNKSKKKSVIAINTNTWNSQLWTVQLSLMLWQLFWLFFEGIYFEEEMHRSGKMSKISHII